ncbi:formate dehydrogenase subunit gamma [Desulfurobacterium pacificum]|jgi:formate dehydrogenase subunit gamma|uniref:Formate dehydrogenase subunit gamma n=1 Tax=Desulfurobacterium pacificum TaxID=240166 RepID=A0ABY1NMJ4_9BACT|nr:cytochrome b/b6 domain-containing protein [Desulfurobacterium pacificum]SMP12610.1 formate dehydrogenase subunit gamma [Desulfurobacterium pacificum]
MKKITVKRHSKLFIFLHWLMVLEAAILLITGLALGPNPAIKAIHPFTARSLHIVVGFFFIGTTVFFFYYFVISGEYMWFGLRRLWEAIDFFFDEIRHFLLRKPVAHKPLYDPKRGDYILKIIPTEVLAWWGWVFLWILLGITGLAIIFPNSFGLVLRFCHALVPDWVEALSSTQAIHGFLAILFVILAMIHAYASWKFGMIKSIITGDHEVEVVEGEVNIKPGNEL